MADDYASGRRFLSETKARPGPLSPRYRCHADEIKWDRTGTAGERVEVENKVVELWRKSALGLDGDKRCTAVALGNMIWT